MQNLDGKSKDLINENMEKLKEYAWQSIENCLKFYTTELRMEVAFAHSPSCLISAITAYTLSL